MLPALRWVILHEIVSLIIQNWNKMPLTAFWGLSRKFSFEVAVRRHFPVVTYLIGLPLMIANFWTRWLLMVDNFLKSHQIETKNYNSRLTAKNFFLKLLCDVLRGQSHMNHFTWKWLPLMAKLLYSHHNKTWGQKKRH